MRGPRRVAATPGRAGAALAIGLVAGLSSGLLGIGGGVVMVPGLVIVLGMVQQQANATSLAAIIPIGAVGALSFAVAGEVNYALAALLALGAVAGAPLGVRVMSSIPEPVLRLIFTAVALAAGVRLVL